MGYTLAGALDALRKLCEYSIIYAEQPVASIEDMAALRFAIAKEGCRPHCRRRIDSQGGRPAEGGARERRGPDGY